MRIQVSCTSYLQSCPSPLPSSASCRKTATAGSPRAENQAIYRLGDEDQSVLYWTSYLPSCPSPLPRSASCRKTAVSKEPEDKTTNHQAMNIKTRSSSTKAAAVQNNCCPTATIVWSVLVCYKVLQDVTYSYSTCQVIPLHLQEAQVAKRHLQLQPDDKTTTSQIRCHSNYFLICPTMCCQLLDLQETQVAETHLTTRLLLAQSGDVVKTTPRKQPDQPTRYHPGHSVI